MKLSMGSWMNSSALDDGKKLGKPAGCATFIRTAGVGSRR
jgi:hypothetical protein